MTDDLPSGPSRIAGVVLAAGAGRRMGQPKALVEGLDGPLLLRAVDAMVEGGCAPVGVVTGAAGDQVAALLPPGIHRIHNDEWASGMAGSVRQALGWAAARNSAGVLILPVDTPDIGAAVVRRLREHVGGSARERVVQATYEGRPRNPVLIGASYFDQVSASTVGDRGARVWLDANRELVEGVECSDIGDPNDLDTPDQLERWRRNAGHT